MGHSIDKEKTDKRSKPFPNGFNRRSPKNRGTHSHSHGDTHGLMPEISQRDKIVGSRVVGQSRVSAGINRPNWCLLDNTRKYYGDWNWAGAERTRAPLHVPLCRSAFLELESPQTHSNKEI